MIVTNVSLMAKPSVVTVMSTLVSSLDLLVSHCIFQRDKPRVLILGEAQNNLQQHYASTDSTGEVFKPSQMCRREESASSAASSQELLIAFEQFLKFVTSNLFGPTILPPSQDCLGCPVQGPTSHPTGILLLIMTHGSHSPVQWLSGLLATRTTCQPGSQTSSQPVRTDIAVPHGLPLTLLSALPQMLTQVSVAVVWVLGLLLADFYHISSLGLICPLFWDPDCRRRAV